MRAAALVIALAAAAPAAAQEDDRVPGLSKMDAQILARPGEGNYIVRLRGDVFPGALEDGIARLCGSPVRAAQVGRDDGRPGNATYLVRCRP